MLRADAHFREVAGGALLAFFLKLIGSGLAFAFNVAVARLLGAEGAGLYFLALSITTIGSVVGRLGLDHALLRFVATHAANRELPKLLGVHALGMRVAVLTCTVISLLAHFSASWVAEEIFRKPDLAEPLRWMALSILPTAVINLQAESMKALKRINEAMLLQSIGVPSLGLLFLWPLGTLAGVEGVAGAYLVAASIVAAVGLWAWRYAVPPQTPREGYSFRKLWASCSPLYVIALLNSAVLTWSPVLLLGLWVSSGEVGIFGAATRLATLVSFLLAVLNNVIAPKFAELFAAGDLEGIGRISRRATGALVLLVSPLFVFLFVFSGQVMSLFGPEFATGSVVFSILLVGQLVNVCSGSVGYLLIMTGNERTIRNITLSAAVVQTLLLLLLAPFIGGIGAATAAASSMALMNAVAVYAVYRRLGILTVPGLRRLIGGV